MLQSIVQLHGVNSRQRSGRGDNDESLRTNYFSSPITHPLVSGCGRFRCCNLTCHQTGIWLWEHLLWKQGISGSWKFFYSRVLYKHYWRQFADAASRCSTIYLAEKWFCFPNGVITKNRTLTKPSCQVIRLSKLKPACLMYLCSFVCSATKRVPSLVKAWLCYAHGCTFLALLSMPSANPLAWH